MSSSSSSPKRRVFVVGVGMTRFEKPGSSGKDYPDFAQEAITKALADAGLHFSAVQQAAVGYVYGDSTCGQRAVYTVGMTGIPVYNVNNNCSTGSTALFLARELLQGGQAECVLALGFEKMERGSLAAKYMDRTNPMDKHMNTMLETRGITEAPFAPQMFGNAGREHMEKFGTTKEHFAKVAEKNHRHSVNNPYSQFRDVYSLDDVLKSKVVFEPLTRLQCCPTSDGAAAAILASEAFVIAHNLQHQAVEILGQSMATDFPSSFTNCIKMVGSDMTRAAATEAFRQAGRSIQDAQVVELHDCFSCNELLTYEALGMCPEGKGGALVDNGQVTYGGKWVVNPSGGLISKGHPLGATGLAQCCELSWQLRQMCGNRQVPNCKLAVQHNLGLGGAAVVTVYGLGFPQAFQAYPKNRPNPAVDPDAFFNSSVAASAAAGAEGFASDAIFAELAKKVNADVVSKVKGIYQFKITKNGAEKIWTVDLKNGNGAVVEGNETKPDCTITITDDDYVNLILGKANGQQLFMQGKIKMAGNMALAMKLSVLEKLNSSGAAGAEGFASDAIFAELAKKVNADVVSKVKGVYQFKITKNGAEKIWTVDLKNGNGAVVEGGETKPDCTITITDDDYVNLILGKANGQQLFMQGKIKMAGNMALAMKLSVLEKLNSSGAAGAEGFASDAIFAELAKKVNADVVSKVKGIYQFKITKNGAEKIWTVDLKNGNGAVVEGNETKPDCTITITDDDYVNLILGKANGQQLFMQGKIKMAGNMALAMKLSVLEKLNSSGAAGAEGFKSDFVFGELAKRVKDEQALVKSINGIYLIKITNGPGGAGKSWIIDLKVGAVREGEGAADCTVTVADEDFTNLLLGKANGQQLFMQGKLKIAGNMALAMKLSQLSAQRASL